MDRRGGLAGVRRLSRGIWRWLAGPLLGYLCLVGLMSALETTLLFPAPSISRAELARAAARFGATEVELEASDGTHLYGWRLKAEAQFAEPRA